jgi:hypothetical protein
VQAPSGLAVRNHAGLGSWVDRGDKSLAMRSRWPGAEGRVDPSNYSFRVEMVVVVEMWRARYEND